MIITTELIDKSLKISYNKIKDEMRINDESL